MKVLGISLPLQILIAILLAIAAGVFFGDLMSVLMPVGDAFIMLLRMAILPYLFFALIHGLGSLDLSQAKRLLRYSVLFLLAIWSATVVTIFVFARVFPQQETGYYYAGGKGVQGGTEGFLKLFIPANPFHALAFNIVPAVVLFAAFFGCSLIFLKRKEQLLKGLDTTVNALTRITRWVIALSPIGIFALISATVGTLSIGQFEKLEIYLISFLVMTLFLTFCALPLILMAFTPVGYRQLLKHLQPALLLSLSTGNIFVSLPYLIHGVNQITGEHTKQSDESYTIIKALVPVAYNLPLVGNLMAMYFVLFLSFFYAIDFTFLDNIKLTVASFFVLPGPVTAAFNSMPFLLQLLRLPHEATGLLVETMSVTRNLQSLAGCMGIAVFTLLTAFSFSNQTSWKPIRIASTIGFACVVLVALVIGIHLTVPIPKPNPPIFLDLTVPDSVPSIIYREGESPPAPRREQEESTLDRIRRLNELRVGYNPHVMPFTYFNAKGELVGYDIAFANALARSLGVSLVFVFFDYDKLIEDVNDDRFDIAMSAVSVTDKRLEHLAFSIPSRIVEWVLIVPDYQRSEFIDLQQVAAQRSLRIGVLSGSAFEHRANEIFPLATIVPLNSYDDILHKPSPAQVLLWTNQEGLTFTKMHPTFTVVATTPSIGKEFYAFAMRASDEEWIAFVNYWLRLRQLDGFSEREVKKWIQGEQIKEKPRWSVIRNVLHWVN